jgi:hypothetical protein
VTQWCVEEALFEALDLSDAFRRSNTAGSIGDPPEAPQASPHAALGEAHARAIAQARLGG